MSDYTSQKSLTDEIPNCRNTGIGFSINQIYRHDGNPQEAHSYEDHNCHLKFADNLYWYAVFDGQNGKQATDYCLQRMIAEIVCWQRDLKTDEEICNFLRQVFATVENDYMGDLGDLLAERTNLRIWLQENSTASVQISKRLAQIKGLLSSGSTAAVVLIFNGKLYVANLGSCRVLLCQNDENSVLKVVQLSVDHDIRNEDELLNLSQIGVNTNNVSAFSRCGTEGNTRCLGNYLIKKEYRDYQIFSTATAPPITATPEVHGGISLDENCRFLVLMSAGLYRSIEEVRGKDQTNQFIAQCIVEQFREQQTLTGVAQAVVDKVVRLHHDWYMSNCLNQASFNTNNNKREDITLVLRNFNYPMPNAISSPSNPNCTFNPATLTNNSNNNTNLNSTITNSTINSTICRDREEAGEKVEEKVDAYVDFTEFYNKFENLLPNS